MATKFKMAAIYKNMACRYWQLLLLRFRLKISHISVRYGFENDAKHLTAVQQITLLDRKIESRNL